MRRSASFSLAPSAAILVARGRTEMATKNDGAQMTREEARQVFDRQARKLLHMSGRDFVREYDARKFDRRREEPAVRRLEMLLPLVRQD